MVARVVVAVACSPRKPARLAATVRQARATTAAHHPQTSITVAVAVAALEQWAVMLVVLLAETAVTGLRRPFLDRL
jgi:hypothetical protein